MKTLFFCVVIISTLNVAQPDFSKQIITTEYDNTMSTQVVDLDKDGDMDIIGTASDIHRISWFENDGNGNFSENVISNSSTWVRTVNYSDFDQDGDIDLVSAAMNQGRVSVWKNNGSQVFAEVIVSGNLPGAHTVSVADINLDGKPDILAACMTNCGFFWFENKGNLTFEKHTLKLCNGPTYIGVCDINKDQKPDIIGSAYSSAGGISLWLNDGTGNFSEIFFQFPFSHWITTGDIDNDGDIDFAGSSCGSSIRIYENDGNMQFTIRTLTNSFGCASSVNFIDIDKDGKLDIIATAETNNDLSWWKNNGNNNFTKYLISSDILGASDASFGDIDKDGDTDIVCSYRFSNVVCVWKNSLIDCHFSSSHISGHAPLEIHFSNHSNFSTPVTEFKWDFNNDGIIDSYLENPAYIYTQPGNYSVSLTVKTGNKYFTKIKNNLINIFNGESCLDFSLNSNIAVSSSNINFDLSNSFTIESFINPSGWGNKPFGEGNILNLGSIGLFLNSKKFGTRKAESIILSLTDSSGKIILYSTPDSSIKLNQWQHVAFTYDRTSNNFRSYINGVEKTLSLLSSNPLTAPIKNMSGYKLILGNSFDSTGTFTGLIDEVRIWNKVRNQNEILHNITSYIAGNSENLAGYWRLNEGNGNLANDLTPNSLNLEIANPVWQAGNNIFLTDMQENHSDKINYPKDLRILSNYPNPFNPATNIIYTVSNSYLSNSGKSFVKLTVFDISGTEVVALVNEMKDPGTYKIVFNAERLTSGIYFLQLFCNNNTYTQKALLIK